jgi:hypothetical protein
VSFTKKPEFARRQLDCPVSGPNVPAPHSTHGPEPAPLKVPTGHALHSLAPAALLEKPAGHDVQDESPSPLKVPISHSSHALAPEPENEPAGHAVCSEAPVLPT